MLRGVELARAVGSTDSDEEMEDAPRAPRDDEVDAGDAPRRKIWATYKKRYCGTYFDDDIAAEAVALGPEIVRLERLVVRSAEQDAALDALLQKLEALKRRDRAAVGQTARSARPKSEHKGVRFERYSKGSATWATSAKNRYCGTYFDDDIAAEAVALGPEIVRLERLVARSAEQDAALDALLQKLEALKQRDRAAALGPAAPQKLEALKQRDRAAVGRLYQTVRSARPQSERFENRRRNRANRDFALKANAKDAAIAAKACKSCKAETAVRFIGMLREKGRIRQSVAEELALLLCGSSFVVVHETGSSGKLESWKRSRRLCGYVMLRLGQACHDVEEGLPWHPAKHEAFEAGIVEEVIYFEAELATGPWAVKDDDAARGWYKCGRCGQLKGANHVCPYETAADRDVGAQCLDPEQPIRIGAEDRVVVVSTGIASLDVAPAGGDAMDEDEDAPPSGVEPAFEERVLSARPFVSGFAPTAKKKRPAEAAVGRPRATKKRKPTAAAAAGQPRVAAADQQRAAPAADQQPAAAPADQQRAAAAALQQQQIVLAAIAERQRALQALLAGLPPRERMLFASLPPSQQRERLVAIRAEAEERVAATRAVETSARGASCSAAGVRAAAVQQSLAMSQRQQHARNVWEFHAAAPAVAAAVNTVGLARADEARASFNLDAAIQNRLAAEHFATAARIVAELCF